MAYFPSPDIYQTGTLYDFYRGNGANCFKIGPETAVKFLLFDHFFVKARLRVKLAK